MDREIRSLQKTKCASLWRSFDTTRKKNVSVLICSIYKPIFLLLQDKSLNESLILENTHIGIISLANSALIAWLNGYMNA